MRRVVMTTVMAVSVALTSVWAGGYTRADRILDMQKMAESLKDIQSGLLYNNYDIIKSGAEMLKETIVKVRPIDEEVNNKDIYEKWLNNHLKMTNKIKKKIMQRAEILEERFADGDAVQALQEYSKIMEQCMKCHVQLRKW